MSGRKEFNESLAAVEIAAIAAIVPGEAAIWLREVTSQMQKSDGHWNRFCDDWRSQSAQVVAAEPTLSVRCDELDAALGELLERRKALVDCLKGLGRKLEQGAQNSSEEPSRKPQELRYDLLHWALDLRMHVVEVDALLMESIYRDRGVVD